MFINTARSYGFIPELILQTLPLDGYVTGIGTDLRLHGRQIFSSVMDREELKRTAAHFLTCEQQREVAFEGESDILWINPRDFRGAKLLVSSPDEFDTIYRETRISKMYISGQLTPEEFDMFGKTNIMYQHASYAEYVPLGFGKAEGMQRMLQMIGIPAERCIAMGDSANDTDMLRAAGISVAMGNAIDELKDFCTYISCDADRGGVAQALRHLLPDAFDDEQRLLS